MTSPTSAYTERRTRFAAERDACARRSATFGRLRLAVIVAAAALAWWGSGLPGEGARRGAYLGAAALVVVFVVLARVHRRVRDEERRLAVSVALQDEGLARIARRWDALPPTPALPAEHPYARDLDVLGHASLRRILGPASPALGGPRLDAWLLAPAEPDEVRARQAAAAELAAMVEMRDALAADARLARPLRADALARLVAWAESPAGGAARGWVVWGSRALGLVATVSFLAWLRAPMGPALWLAPAAVNALITAVVVRRAWGEFARASGPASSLEGVSRAMTRVAAASLAAPWLRARHDALGAHASSPGAAAATRRLVRLVALSELRFSPMMHFVVNAFTLLDVQVLASLERWRAHAGPHAREWFDALADVDAMAAIATLAHDEPAWTFPELVDGPARVEATALAHPLLADDVRVANDVAVGPPGTFLLVTGSNMSGKSTLLRAIGANVVLAQAGAPTCATSLRLTPLAVRTSMRVEDSLEQGVSLFMAELLRLRSVVESAREARRAGTPPVLFLLDEILHGTNTAERQIAARLILLGLVREGAIGAVSTHDLALADADSLRAAAHAVHFTEQFVPAHDGAPARMTFDYRLLPGIATSVNAMRLVEMMGLVD